MEYLHTYPSAILGYQAGNIQIKVESDAAYLVLLGAKIRIAEHYTLTNNTAINSLFTSPINTECKTVRQAICSSAESETHGIFQNSQNAVVIRYALLGLVHVQNI